MGVKKGEKVLSTPRRIKIMARKITIEAINAFMEGDTKNCNGYGCIFSKDNTIVTRNNGVMGLHLHGNHIAKRTVGSNDIQITNAGWFSTTTKERLNGLPGVSVCQRKGVWFLNGKEWDGSWITV